MDKIVAIITTYNGKKWYGKCFGKLRKSKIPLDIVAVDNASTDDSVKYIREHFPEVRLIESPTNLGFGKANNLGIRFAIDNAADYVFLINQDAWTEPSTVEKLVSIQKVNPRYGILSPLHLNGNGDSLDKKFSYYAGPEYTNNFLSDLSLNKVCDIYKTKFVNAAAWLVSAECVKKVGGFDPIFFHYGEDYNYCQRTTYHGRKIGIVPSAKIYHDRVYKDDKYDSQQILLNYILTVADINNSNYHQDHKRLKNQDLIRIITALLKNDLIKFKQNIRNLRAKKNLFPLVEKSRRKNKAGGIIYL